MIGANISKETRKSIYKREGYQCAVCGSTRQLEIHHVVKRSRGGGNNPENLVCLCHICHCLVHGERAMPEAYRRSLGPLREEDVELALVEYLADYYAENEGRAWWPWADRRDVQTRDARRSSRWPEVFVSPRWEEEGF